MNMISRRTILKLGASAFGHRIFLPFVAHRVPEAAVSDPVFINVPGDYALLSEALAAAVAGDIILVSGDIVEQTKIHGKTGVHVYGVGVASVTVADIPDLEAFRFVNITDAEWRGLTLRRTGTADRAQLMIVTGASDARFENCQFENEASGASHSIGVWIGLTASPVFRNCSIRGGIGGPYCYGADCSGESTPLFVECTINGGAGENRCYGLHVSNSASPTVIDSWLQGGDGGENCDGARLESDRQPVLVRCVGTGNGQRNSHGITMAGDSRAVVIDCGGFGAGADHSHGLTVTGSAKPTVIDCLATGGTGSKHCQGLLVEVDGRPVLNRVTAAVGAEGQNNNALGFIHDCQPVTVELKTVNQIVDS